MLDKQVENKPLRNEKGQLLPGQTANPAGRPKGQTLKEFVREWLMSMSQEEREKFLDKIPKDIIWKMAEGNPAQEEQHSGTIEIIKHFEQRGFSPKQDDIYTERISERTSTSEQEI